MPPEDHKLPLAEAMTALVDRVVPLEGEHAELTRKFDRLGEKQQARSRAASRDPDPGAAQRRASRARSSAAVQERRRVVRDLHNGVENELTSLIVGLALAEQDHDTPPLRAGKLSALGARAQATLDAIREVAHGIHPRLLAAAGFVEAIRAQAGLAPVAVGLVGTAPRSSDDAEQAVYFACLEALQNVAKHAGREARATLRVRHRGGRLAVRVEDDGGGFDRVRGREGVGLASIGDRIASFGGTVRITSAPGRGTVLAAALPRPANRRSRPRLARDHGQTGLGQAVTERAARVTAEIVREGQTTSAGGSLFDHVQRVADAVPEHAGVTAWLREVLDRTDITIAQLRAQGLSRVELGALALLTRTDHDDYRAYVQRIADASGRRGAPARVVKLLDLEDHLADSHAASRSTQPYAWARRAVLLAQGADVHLYAVNVDFPARTGHTR